MSCARRVDAVNTDIAYSLNEEKDKYIFFGVIIRITLFLKFNPLQSL